MLIDFNLTLLNSTQNSLSETHSQIQAAPRIEVTICFFYGAPSTQHFYLVKCFKSFLLGRICREQSLSFLVLFFHHLSYSDYKNLILTMQDLVKHLRWSLCKVN